MKRHFLRSATVCCTLAAAAHAAPQPASSADRFVDSIGVCTHWSYPDTPYGSAFEKVKARLIESGIRHVRDGLTARVPELGRAGVFTTVVTDVEKTPAKWVEAVKEANAGGPWVVAVEGPNEPDLFWPRFKKSYAGKGHEQGDAAIIEGTIAFQKDLYAAFKADAATRAITVIGPALGKTYGYDTKSPLGTGTLTAAVDWGNFHPYPGGNPFSVPFPYAGVEKYIWHGDTPTTGMGEAPHAFDVYAPPFAPKPMAATETGYSTFDGGTPEPVHAKYLPRLFAEYFRKGIQRTFSYEFVDEFNKPEEREANFGLLRHDLSPKPAYFALQRLIALLAEKSPRAGWQPGALDFALEVKKAGAFHRTQDVHHLLRQKSSGEFWLLLWHEVALTDTSKRPFRRLPLAPPMPTKLTFATPLKAATLWIPNDGAEPVAQWKGPLEHLEIGVLDRVMVLSLRAN